MELAGQKIPFVSEAEFKVSYNGGVCGTFKVDFWVEGKVILELKAASDICEDHISQGYAYLKATGAKLVILLNFGRRRLQTHRLVMSNGEDEPAAG